MNQGLKDTIYAAMKFGLVGGGPIGAIVLRYTHLSMDDWNLWLQAGLFVVPPTIAGFMEWLDKRKAGKIAAASKLSEADVRSALPQLSDSTKALILNAVPNVETIVVNDNATGDLGVLADSNTHPNIVRASQNELDAKRGVKV